MDRVKIIECPRDAWQGLPNIIPTDVKVAYLRKLIEAGFRHIDAVSFVAPKYVPQMADSEQVMAKLQEAWLVHNENRNSKFETRPKDPNLEFRVSRGRGSAEFCLSNSAARGSEDDERPQTSTPSLRYPTPNPESRTPAPEIIGIVVNEQGLQRALATAGVATLGYPYSVSANFRRSNANMSLSESRALVQELQRATKAAGRNLVVYVSMAFGNPYDEPWSPEVTAGAVSWLQGVGVKTVSLADTVGTAQPKDVAEVFRENRSAAPGIELGVHLHSRREGAVEKVWAAYEAGCRRFDSALNGLGGCPFAGDDLVGNIPTETVVSTLAERGVETGIEPWALLSAVEATNELRTQYATREPQRGSRPG